MNTSDITLDEGAQIRAAVGARIRSRRKFLMLSQAALAEQLSVSQETISQIEIGNRSVTAADLPKIASALGVRIEHLFGEFPTANTNGGQVVLTEDEVKLLDFFRDVSGSSRLIVIELLQSLHKREHGL